MEVGARVRWVNQLGRECAGEIYEVVPARTFPAADVTATKYRKERSYVVLIPDPRPLHATRLVWPPNRLLHTMEVIDG